MLRIFGLIFVLVLAACRSDETLSGYAGAGSQWVLVSLEGQAVTARITLELPQKGQITGQGPCNRYSARQSAPLPWFALSAIAATKRACADLALEQKYFSSLQQANLAEVIGDQMILSKDSNMLLVFVRVQP